MIVYFFSSPFFEVNMNEHMGTSTLLQGNTLIKDTYMDHVKSLYFSWLGQYICKVVNSGRLDCTCIYLRSLEKNGLVVRSIFWVWYFIAFMPSSGQMVAANINLN